MPDTIADLAHRLVSLGRRVTALERARNQPYPPWRDLPLTGKTSIPDAARPPQVRANPWHTLEFSGRIGLSDGRATDTAVIALLPDGYRPAAPRTLPVASDARRALQIDIDPSGRVALRVHNGGTVKGSWISLDGASCRAEGDEDE